MDLFDSYKKMFASTTDTPVCWWYCGMVFTDIAGFGELPMSQAETLMVFRTASPDQDTLTIEWREIGYFRDIATGEVVGKWTNPFTGKNEVRAASFEDGPALYTIKRTPDGVAIKLRQSHAEIEGVTLVVSSNDGQRGLVQTEDKTRTYQRADGSWPDVDSDEASRIRTVLSIYSSEASIADPRSTSVAASGFYTSGSIAKGGAGAWGSSVVRGVMRKAAVDEVLNPIAWGRLKALYPQFFKNNTASPQWD